MTASDGVWVAATASAQGINMTKLCRDDLGNVGQNLLERLALEGHMVANPPGRDLHGWDCMLELRSESKPTPPYDLAQLPPRAFVQVKTTASDANGTAIKLSNWHRMVSDPCPWFVLAVQCNADGLPLAAFLVHIHEHWMERALRRLRECDAAPHTVTMNVSWSDADRLTNVSGTDLRAALEAHIGADLMEYQRRKHELATGLGYDQATNTVVVRFPNKDKTEQIREWTEHALGLRDSLDVEHVEVTERRFGIASAPTNLGGPGKMSFKPKPRSVQIRVIAADGVERVTATALLYSTGTIPHIPKDEARARFQVGPFSLVLQTGSDLKSDEPGTRELQADLRWDEDGEHTVAQLGKAAAFYRISASAGARIEFVLDASEPHRSQSVMLSGFALSADRNDELAELEAARRVLERFGLEERLASSSLADGCPQFTLLDSLMSRTAPDVEIGVECSEQSHERFAVIIAPAAWIGDHAIVGVFALLGAPRYERGLTRVRGDRVQIGSVEIVERSRLETFDLAARLTKFDKDLEAEHGDAVLVVRPKEPGPLFLHRTPEVQEP